MTKIGNRDPRVLAVGTRGGCGDGRGPCACPRHHMRRLGSVRSTGRTPDRTSTRPPHPPHPSPCPYSTLGRLQSSHYRFWLEIFIIGLPRIPPLSRLFCSPSDKVYRKSVIR